jgi:hypothetical protein
MSVIALLRGIDVERRMDAPAAVRPRADGDGSGMHGRALAHADETAPGSVRRHRVVGGLVVDRQRDDGSVVSRGDVDAARSGRVAQDVGQRFLHDAVGGEAHAAPRNRRAVVAPGHGEPRFAELGDEGSDAVCPGLWGELRGVARSAEHAEEAPHLGERLSAGLGDATHRVGGQIGCGLGLSGRALAEGDHDGQTVRDDVVHLAGDASALLADSETGALVALAGEVRGTIDERLLVAAAPADRDADEGRDREHHGCLNDVARDAGHERVVGVRAREQQVDLKPGEPESGRDAEAEPGGARRSENGDRVEGDPGREDPARHPEVGEEPEQRREHEQEEGALPPGEGEAEADGGPDGCRGDVPGVARDGHHEEDEPGQPRGDDSDERVDGARMPVEEAPEEAGRARERERRARIRGGSGHGVGGTHQERIYASLRFMTAAPPKKATPAQARVMMRSRKYPEVNASIDPASVLPVLNSSTS